MYTVRFEWDSSKSRINLQKHGVSFEMAAQVFQDPHCLVEPNSMVDGEERLQALGMAGGSLIVLFVVYTERNSPHGEETIRIISARKAREKERSRYSSLR